MNTIMLKAYAKINLTLDVFEKNINGLHNLLEQQKYNLNKYHKNLNFLI